MGPLDGTDGCGNCFWYRHDSDLCFRKQLVSGLLAMTTTRCVGHVTDKNYSISIVDSYASYAASAVAAKTLMRSLVGASVPLWVTQLFHNLGFQYAGLFLALVSCLILVSSTVAALQNTEQHLTDLVTIVAYTLPVLQIWSTDSQAVKPS